MGKRSDKEKPTRANSSCDMVKYATGVVRMLLEKLGTLHMMTDVGDDIKGIVGLDTVSFYGIEVSVSVPKSTMHEF